MSADLLVSLGAPFLVGLLGGVHCAMMCGGIAAALGLQARRPVAPASTGPMVVAGAAVPLQRMTYSPAGAAPLAAGAGRSGATATPTATHWPRLLGFNAGRIGLYTLLGALAGAIGSVAWLLDDLLPVQQAAWGLTSLVLVLMGAYLWGWRQPADWLERLGRPVWQLLRPAATRSLGTAGTMTAWRALGAGALWGMVPCAMVYGVLLSAVASGGARDGALLMLAFGLGTLPNLLLLGASGAWLQRFRQMRPVRRAAAALLMLFGVLGLVRLFATPGGPLAEVLCYLPVPG
ncbi:MAG: sulfite exporter TauE/SafE family protein [Burkholderiaceae bacterium]